MCVYVCVSMCLCISASIRLGTRVCVCVRTCGAESPQAADTTPCSVVRGEGAAPAGVVKLAATVAPLVACTPVSDHGAAQAVVPPGVAKGPGVANGVAAPLADAALPTGANGTPTHAKGPAAQTPPATGVCLGLCRVCLCVCVCVCACVQHHSTT